MKPARKYVPTAAEVIAEQRRQAAADKAAKEAKEAARHVGSVDNE